MSAARPGLERNLSPASVGLPRPKETLRAALPSGCFRSSGPCKNTSWVRELSAKSKLPIHEQAPAESALLPCRPPSPSLCSPFFSGYSSGTPQSPKPGLRGAPHKTRGSRLLTAPGISVESPCHAPRDAPCPTLLSQSHATYPSVSSFHTCVESIIARCAESLLEAAAQKTPSLWFLTKSFIFLEPSKLSLISFIPICCIGIKITFDLKSI